MSIFGSPGPLQTSLNRTRTSRLLTNIAFVAFGVLYAPAMAFAVPALPAQLQKQAGQPEQAAATDVAESEATQAQSQLQTEKKPMIESKQWIADGQPTRIDHVGLTIVPPAGWDVTTHAAGVTIIMEAPKTEAKDVSEGANYRRNITASVIHTPSPIDETRANEVKLHMQETYGKNSLTKEFQVLDHKFFNFRGENDGLIVYSTMMIDEIPLMQMHVLVSGAEKQYLMTYTDLASSFTNQSNGFFEEAWNTMTAIEINGVAPSRMEQWLRYGSIAGGILVFFGLLGLLRRKARRRDYNDEADALYSENLSDDSSSVMATLAFGWRLDRRCPTEPWNDDEFGSFDDNDDLPKTKVASQFG